MRGGGEFLLEEIPWFNGDLFETVVLVPLATAEIAALLDRIVGSGLKKLSGVGSFWLFALD